MLAVFFKNTFLFLTLWPVAEGRVAEQSLKAYNFVVKTKKLPK